MSLNIFRFSKNCTTLIGLLFVLGSASCVFAQVANPAQSAAMTAADRAFAQAVTQVDSGALAKLLDADFTWTAFDGKTWSKAQVLQSIPKPILANEGGAERKQYLYGELGDMQVNSGRSHALRVWARRGDGSKQEDWKLIVYQEVMSLAEAPTFAPGAGKDCENPCKGIPFQPANETDRQVAAAYSNLETAAMAKNSAVFSTMVADEFVAASSNSDKIVGKRERMDDFDHSKNAGVAPTPLKAARMFDFGEAVLMTSDHVPDRGKPLRVTRVWVRRNGNWVETLSYQTSVQAVGQSGVTKP